MEGHTGWFAFTCCPFIYILMTAPGALAGVLILFFFGTLLFGPNMTMVLGMALVKKEKQFLYWTMAGTVVWSMVLTILATYSVETFNRIA